MAGDKVKAPSRGETYYGPQQSIDTANYGNAVGLEGLVGIFKDYDPAITYGAGQPRSSGEVTAVFARNVGPATVFGKTVVQWKTGQRFKRFDGLARLDWQEGAGIVDEFLDTNGCRVGDMCWIVVQGPTLVLTSLGGDATNVITDGDILFALTAATSGSTTAGRVQSLILTTNTTVIQSMAFNRLGKALSTKTTANTNTGVLVWVDLFR